MAKQIAVRITADISKLVTNLKKAEKQLSRSGRKMSRIGDDLMRSLTLPFAAIGGAAIKSFGDLEKFENGLTSIMGSSEAATAELEKLKEAAKLPGLGFEQAVKGSVRLQSVGFSAEAARRSMSAVGNAIALVGGGAAELDRATLALQQIAAKGKVSAEELNQLNEVLPQIRTAMKGAFGTADTEVLNDMGVSSEEFINKITAQLEELPTATGGVANAIENATMSIKMSLAEAGRSINENFDLTAKIDGFANSIQALAERFANLSKGQQKAVVIFGTVVAAIGPVIKIIGVLQTTYAQGIGLLKTTIQSYQKLIGTLKRAAMAFKAMDMASKATAIGLVIAAVATAVIAFQQWNAQLSQAEKVQNALTEVQTRAAQSIAEERIQADLLVSVLKDENATRDQKVKALNQLKAANSDYFGDLSIEKSSIKDITKAYDAYIANLLQSAKIRAAQDKLIEIEKKQLDLQERMNEAKPTFLQQSVNLIKSGGNALQATIKNSETLTANYIKQNEALEAQKQALTKVIVASKKIETGGDGGGDGGGKNNGGGTPTAITQTTTAIEEQTEAVQRNILAFSQLPSIQTQVAETGNHAADVFKDISDKLGIAAESVRINSQALKEFNEGFTNIVNQGITDFTTNFAEMMGQVAAGKMSFKSLGVGLLETLAGVLSQLGKMAIQTGVAILGIRTALQSLNPGIAIAAGVALVGLASAVKSRLSDMATPMAKGGIVMPRAGGTIAQIGEAGQAEAVIPLNRLDSMLSGGGGGGKLEAQIRGEDIYFMLQRVTRKSNRVR